MFCGKRGRLLLSRRRQSLRRAGGNRTIIYRSENRVADLKDLNSMSNPLQDGDRIELGKKVLLKFEIDNEILPQSP